MNELSDNARRTLRQAVAIGGTITLDAFDHRFVAPLRVRGLVTVDTYLRTLRVTDKGIVLVESWRGPKDD